MNRKLLFQLMVLGIGALLVMPVFFSNVARADGGGGDRETSVNYPGNGGYFSVDSQSTNAVGPKNEFNMVFAGNTFLMQFKNDSQNTGYSLQFSIQLERLMLVNSTSTTYLLNFSQQEFNVLSPLTAFGGQNTFSLYTESDMAKFVMTVQTTNVPAQNGSVTILPNEVKISFQITITGDNIGEQQNMQLGHPPVPTGNVILQLGLSSGDSNVTGIQNNTTFSNVGFSDGKSSGYFSWSNTAIVDGKASAVGSSLSGTSNLSLVYPAGLNIIHDPYIGISPSTIVNIITHSLGNIVIYTLTLAVSAAFIGGAMTYRRRRG